MHGRVDRHDRETPPGSLLPVHVLGPVAMLIAMVATLAQWGGLAGEDAPAMLFVTGVPALTMCATAYCVSGRKRRRAWFAAAIGFVLQTCLMIVTTRASTSGKVIFETVVVSLIVAVFTFGLFAIMTAPLLIAASHYAKRRDLASGDDLLAAAALWLLLLQAVEAMVVRDAFAIFGVVMGASFAVLCAAFVCGRRRRSWCRRVEQGRVPGLRVRAWDKRDLDQELPAVDDAPHGDLAVIERIATGNLPYRTAMVGVPLATMRTEIELGA